MNCKRFEIELADWLRGRLSADLAARMIAHRDSCGRCAAAEKAEQTVMAAWNSSPPAREVELWPRVSLRVEQPERRSVFAPRRLAFGFGALAMGALAAVLFVSHPATNSARGGSPDRVARDAHAVTIVAAMQQVPDPDRDGFTQDPQYDRLQHPHDILYGAGSRR